MDGIEHPGVAVACYDAISADHCSPEAPTYVRETGLGWPRKIKNVTTTVRERGPNMFRADYASCHEDHDDRWLREGPYAERAKQCGADGVESDGSAETRHRMSSQHWHASAMHLAISHTTIHHRLSIALIASLGRLGLSSSAPELDFTHASGELVALRHFLKQRPQSPLSPWWSLSIRSSLL
jgi:hypothetical protein